MTAYVFLPGFGNSIGEHWQNQWFKKLPNSYWLEQEHWNEPECTAWVACLQSCVQNINEPIIFISHSLGCLTVVEWVEHDKSENHTQNIAKISGAFMVAVPDPLNSNVPPSIRGYSKYPLTPLPFPSKMIASTNDPYCNVRRTEFFAKNWGSELEFIGAQGHINTSAGFGEWNEGLAILQQWRKSQQI